MTRTKWIVRPAKKYPHGPVFHKLTSYAPCDLVALTDEFKKNRKFDTYLELFDKSEKKTTWTQVYKSGQESREVFFKRKATKIAKVFFDLLTDDLIFNDVEYNFTPKAKIEKRHVLSIGYMRTVEDVNRYKKTNYAYVYGGLVYYLKYISPYRKKRKHRRYAIFCTKRMNQMRAQINNGMRYHTFYKDRLFSQI
jgi:hypothetical protein